MDPSIEVGRRNASPAPGEEIVITGMAGKFPNSDNIRDFQENLYNKMSMMDDDTRRWEHYHPQIPKMAGKLYNIDKFDAGFFGIQQHQSNIMDPMVRLLLERTFEAICDAGCSLEELRGSKTGVFIGVCVSDTEKKWVEESIVKNSFAITGCLRAMLAIRVSYFFQFEGPSCVFDTACSSSLYALEHAYKVMREGKCETAIVGGTNLCLQPLATLEFSRLGVLSPNEGCRSFDEAANGYTRAEAICVLFMQKAKNARRILGKVIHTKCNVDGFKPLGITYPSGEVQKQLFTEVYEECNLLPADVTYVEAHATGTKIGDFEEMNAIGTIFCKGRERPLCIGSVKSSIGHTEPASALCAIIKVLIGMENNSIPPNIRFSTPRKDVDDLVSGRMRVVTEAMPWPNNKAVVGVNSFGFGGANAHIVLKWNEVTKESKSLPDDDLLRLICVSGRTQDATAYILNDIAARKFDMEFINLIQEVFKGNVPNHIYRSYGVLSKTGELLRESSYFVEENKIFMYTFANCTEDAFDIVQELRQIPIASRIFENLWGKCYSKNNQFWNIVLQVIIIDILKKIQLKDVYYQGSGLFALCCGYFDNILSLEETFVLAHSLLQDSNQKMDNNIEYFERVATEKWVNMERNISANYFFEEYHNPHAVSESKDDLALQFSSFKKGKVVFDMLNALGTIYLNGGNFKVSELFPPIKYPVSRGTPMISPLIKWDHNRSWYVTKSQTTIKSPSYRMIKIDMNDEYWSFINGHIVDGRNLFPATGYLLLAWITLASIQTKIYTQMKIVFSHVRFIRATPVSNEVVQFCLMFSKSDGYFEICDNGITVVSGYMHEGDETHQLSNLPEPIDDSEGIVLKEQDIYTELKIRGYSYKGYFKGIEETQGSIAKLKWKNNWVTFMDCMLQAKLLQQDTRNLYVPTGIDYMIIDARGHKEFTEKLNDKSTIELQMCKALNTIKTEFIEVRGLRVIAIPRKKNVLVPCLDSYRFIPNYSADLTLQEIIRVNVQIIHENHYTVIFKVCSISDGEEPLFETHINDALNDIVVVKLDLKTLTPEELKEDVEKYWKLKEKDPNMLVIGKYLLNSEYRPYAAQKLSDYGFLLTYEGDDVEIPDDFCVITNFLLNDKRLILLKKRDDSYKDYTLHELTMDESWVPNLQNALRENSKTVVCSRNPHIGVMGLMNCIRRERKTKLVRCFIFDQTTPHNFDDQLMKLMMFNVYEDGCWGTYRHLPLSRGEKIFVDHTFLKVAAPGDFSSLKWMQGNLRMDAETDTASQIIKVYCSAVNFKDIMITSGRLSDDVIFCNRIEQQRLHGMEFAGKDNKGARVMGMLSSGALASLVQRDKYLLWDIPDEWSMEDAATIPVVYSTVLYALTYAGNYKQNSSILIHCGSGGVGQAAINITLSYGYTVFTTVGSQEKVDFIRKQFPQIKPSRIGYSRDTSFEQMIYKETNGLGVDIVLNSLSDEKMAASIRCLATGGTFLEIGKYDVVLNNSLQMELCQKQATFHGIMPDLLLTKNSKLKPFIFKLVNEAIKKGLVIPLCKNIFKMSEIEDAFRFMASGKHIGKVVVSMRNEYKDEDTNGFQAVPQYNCDSNSVYIIIGGLGGFGLELADWLLLRGATKIVLTTRNGVQTGYQHSRIELWKQYGAQIILSREDCSTKHSCYKLLNAAKEYGEVAGIFNLAMVIKDDVFENMSDADFEVSFKPKYLATKYLDKESRILCPTLKDFVVFSSVSCGRGNAGQSNYGMANSFMERICEVRKVEGLPGLAIQWGAVGDVGIVAQMQGEQIAIEVAGTVPQPIASCLDVMDVLMKQGYPVVSSLVVAEKHKTVGANPIVASILQILGLRDLNKVSMYATLPELGMDSIMGVEINQRLERDYEVYLSPQDLRNLTLKRLMDIEKSKNTGVVIKQSAIKLETLMSMIYRQIVDEKISNLSYMRFPENCGKDRETIFLFPGIEGTAFGYEEIAKNLDAPAVSFHYTIIKETVSSIQDIAKSVLPMVESEITNGRFNIISYSFGACVAMELVALLEAKDYQGKLAIIEGSPDLTQKYFQEILNSYWEDFFDTSAMSSDEKFAKMMDKFTFPNFSEKVKIEDYSPRDGKHSKEYLMELLYSVYKKIKIAHAYKPAFEKLMCKPKLFKANIGLIDNLSLDYDLSKFFEQKLVFSQYDGNHYSILTNKIMIQDLSQFTQEKF